MLSLSAPLFLRAGFAAQSKERLDHEWKPREPNGVVDLSRLRSKSALNDYGFRFIFQTATFRGDVYLE